MQNYISQNSLLRVSNWDGATERFLGAQEGGREAAAVLHTRIVTHLLAHLTGMKPQPGLQLLHLPLDPLPVL